MQPGNSASIISKLFAIRNTFGFSIADSKLKLINNIDKNKPASGHELKLYYDTLLFLLAYPDNKEIYTVAMRSLDSLVAYLRSHEGIRARLFNSGATGSELGGAFSFEMTKWFYEKHYDDVFVLSINADDGQLQAILAALLPKVESEILQDANENWKTWLRTSRTKPNLLKKLLDIFEQSPVRPEVKDELWNALGIMVQIDFTTYGFLPASLTKPFYHRSMVKKDANVGAFKPAKIKLTPEEAEQVTDCSKMILVRHMREMDPITFTNSSFVSLYQLPRGLSVALLGMPPDTRHPIDSYITYVAFKNGLPVGYGGAWVLFDSSRTALNIFPSYRGGESKYIFEQVLELKRQVYHLKRFTADTYQIGKENHDGIKSGSFWVYYNVGFRSMEKKQFEIAEAEAQKIKTSKGYRSPADILKQLADSRIEWVLQKNAFPYDATDIARAYKNIVDKKYKGNRKLAEGETANKLATLLQIKNLHHENMNFVLRNWSVVLLANEKELRSNKKLKDVLRKVFQLKAFGSEEEYIRELQRSAELKIFMEKAIRENLTHK